MALEIDGETCFDPKKVANCFNKFFTTAVIHLHFGAYESWDSLFHI